MQGQTEVQVNDLITIIGKLHIQVELMQAQIQQQTARIQDQEKELETFKKAEVKNVRKEN